MPYYEYQCKNGHKFTVFFATFSEAEPHEDNTVCKECLETAQRLISVPLPAHLYGSQSGYHKPSPTKRHSWKLANKETGNAESAG